MKILLREVDLVWISRVRPDGYRLATQQSLILLGLPLLERILRGGRYGCGCVRGVGGIATLASWAGWRWPPRQCLSQNGLSQNGYGRSLRNGMTVRGASFTMRCLPETM
mmetsp:Transcript_116/g.58  ORF Transcript_116/g.58 Transcript_116/m.58 type:complete len:109 (-) Transcript_116:334-660(-)